MAVEIFESFLEMQKQNQSSIISISCIRIVCKRDILGGRQLALDHGDQLGEGGGHEVSPVLVLVQLRPEAGGHGLLLGPGQEGVVRGAEEDDEAAVGPGLLPPPRVAEVAGLGLRAVTQV